jgi:hypothetical protein
LHEKGDLNFGGRRYGIYQYNYMKYKTRGFFLKFTFNFKSGKETEDISRDSSAREILRRTGN